MVSLRGSRTGISNSIFISTKGNTRHAARVKIAIDPPDSFSAAGTDASMAIADFRVTGASIPQALARQVRQYIELNRAVLLEYWDEKIDTAELIDRLKPIED